MNTAQLLTLVFAGIGALGVLYNIVVGLVSLLSARSDIRQQIVRDWEMDAFRTDDPDRFDVTLRYNAALTKPLVLKEVSTRAPAGLQVEQGRIRLKIWERLFYSIDVSKQVITWGKTAVLGQTMRSEKIPLSNVPPKPFAEAKIAVRVSSDMDRSEPVRFTLKLTVEEDFGARRISTFEVKSDEFRLFKHPVEQPASK